MIVRALRSLPFYIMLMLLTWSVSVSAETLESVIIDLLENHPEAQISYHRWQAQQQRHRAEKADFLPSLNLTIGGGRQEKHYPEGSTSETDGDTLARREASLSFRQNLFSGFESTHAVRGAEQLLMAEQWRLQKTYDELALNIIDVVLEVLELRGQMRLVEQNLSKHKEVHKKIQIQLAQGVARRSDLTEIEGRLAGIHVEFLSTQNRLLDAEHEYLNLTGKIPEALPEPAYQNYPMPEDLSRALAHAYNDNPSIRAADHEIQSSQSRYKVAQSKNLPTVDLEVDWTEDHNANGTKGSGKNVQAMINVRYNLFSGGRNQARIKEAAYRVEETRSKRNRTILNVKAELRRAWAVYQLSDEKKKWLQRQKENNQQTVNDYYHQFDLGKRTHLDLLDVENTQFRTAQSLNSQFYEAAKARYQILGATGKLLPTLGIQHDLQQELVAKRDGTDPVESSVVSQKETIKAEVSVRQVIAQSSTFTSRHHDKISPVMKKAEEALIVHQTVEVTIKPVKTAPIQESKVQVAQLAIEPVDVSEEKGASDHLTSHLIYEKVFYERALTDSRLPGGVTFERELTDDVLNAQSIQPNDWGDLYQRKISFNLQVTLRGMTLNRSAFLSFQGGKQQVTLQKTKLESKKKEWIESRYSTLAPWREKTETEPIHKQELAIRVTGRLLVFS